MDESKKTVDALIGKFLEEVWKESVPSSCTKRSERLKFLECFPVVALEGFRRAADKAFVSVGRVEMETVVKLKDTEAADPLSMRGWAALCMLKRLEETGKSDKVVKEVTGSKLRIKGLRNVKDRDSQA